MENVMYTASVTAEGGREGHVRSQDGVIDMDLRMPGKEGENPATNPEQLFAAGYAACFCSAINHAALASRMRIAGITVTVTVGLGKTDEKGYFLSTEILARIPGTDMETAKKLVAEAEDLCPYSKATRGNIDSTVKVEV